MRREGGGMVRCDGYPGAVGHIQRSALGEEEKRGEEGSLGESN